MYKNLCEILTLKNLCLFGVLITWLYYISSLELFCFTDFFFNKNFVLKINKDVFKNKCFCKIQSIRVNLFNGGICLNLILIHSELGMGHNSVVVSAHSVMCRGVDPTWWIHWVISHSSQLLTAGVTKAVGCVILSRTQCLLEVEVTTSEMYFSYSFSTTWLKSRPKSNVSLNEHDQKYVGPTTREENQFPKHGSLKLWLGFNLRYGFHTYLLDLVPNKRQKPGPNPNELPADLRWHKWQAVSHDSDASLTESLSELQLALVDIQAGEVQVPWTMVPSTQQWSAWGDVCRKSRKLKHSILTLPRRIWVVVGCNDRARLSCLTQWTADENEGTGGPCIDSTTYPARETNLQCLTQWTADENEGTGGPCIDSTTYPARETNLQCLTPWTAHYRWHCTKSSDCQVRVRGAVKCLRSEYNEGCDWCIYVTVVTCADTLTYTLCIQ